MAIKYVQSNTLYLAGSGVIVGATSITLTSFSDIYGNVLTMTDFGSKGYITLEPDTTNEESAVFTGVTANANGTYTLTGVSTTLAVSPYTETSGLVRGHSGGTKVVITDNVGFWNTFTNKANNETITGIWIAPTGGSGAQIATSTDIANAITGFTGLATNLVAGTTKLSVAAVSGSNPIAVGDNDTRVPPVNTSTMTDGQVAALPGNNTDVAVGSGNKFVTQTGLQHNAEKYAADTSVSSPAYVITLSPGPTSLTAGMVVYAKLINANTTATPTLNVNGIGAKTIVKNVSTPLLVGDISTNKFCEFMYDGTNLILLNPTFVDSKFLYQIPAVTTANDTSENTVFSVTVPGGLLSSTGGLFIRIPFTCSAPPSGSSPTHTIRLKLGATTIATGTITYPDIGGGTGKATNGILEAEVFNASAKNSQNGVIAISTSITAANAANAVWAFGGTVAGTSAIDTTADATLAVTLQKSNTGQSTVFFRGSVTAMN